MGKAALPLILLLMAYVLVEGVTLHKTKHRFDPVYIFEQFLATNHAVTRCGNPEDERLEQYLRNLRSVTERARDKVQERNPGASIESVDHMITARRKEREAEVDAVIEAGGCSDPKVKTLLKRFAIQARVRAG